jgi:cytochrome c peroxidase
MKKICVTLLLIISSAFVLVSFKKKTIKSEYMSGYSGRLDLFKKSESDLLNFISETDINSKEGIKGIKEQIYSVKSVLKNIDFWLRYLEPVAYKKINGPLPVEWETEVFEKFEKPYKREGAGLSLAALYLEEQHIEKDSLLKLIQSAMNATETFGADSVTGTLKTYPHFYLCNRLFLLNLASIYTTGFECPDTARIIPELQTMLNGVKDIYRDYNANFTDAPLTNEYATLYDRLLKFTAGQSLNYSEFDNFSFIKEYVNPLFSLNQKLISQYGVASKSFVDYSLNKNCTSIFSKELYNGQNSKGIFLRVKDEKVLAEIEQTGKLLFYDPLLSGNNMRSCASCHKPTMYFTDSVTATSLQLNHHDFLLRNTPSLINAAYNHLAMLDGKHISLQNQAKDVITNLLELGSDENEAVQKVMSCYQYKKTFNNLLQYTPQETEVTLEHIVSAITVYYSKFSKYYSPFDEAMNDNKSIDAQVKQGFNLFMSKAQCATCHFVPQFNGVKPPFVSSEFEVLGTPLDTAYTALSADKGRYLINPASETLHAFRTGSIRNAEHTKPYMHNGVFASLNQVIDFYDAGGGQGKGLKVDNQTLSSDPLHLTSEEKSNLLAFIKSLNENILFEATPEKLPASKNKILNKRRAGGEY